MANPCDQSRDQPVTESQASGSVENEPREIWLEPDSARLSARLWSPWDLWPQATRYIRADLVPAAPEPRVNDWIQTCLGIAFYPLNPNPDDVSIFDIAHALSMKCRFNGHSSQFYSVAEHCVHVSYHVPRQDALWALLHDAAEAYSADVPRPLKRCMPEWRPLEERIMQAVIQSFGLSPECPASVTAADQAILADERAQLMAGGDKDWHLPLPPLGIELRCWAPLHARDKFLDRFDEILAQMASSAGPAVSATAP